MTVMTDDDKFYCGIKKEQKNVYVYIFAVAKQK